MNQGLLELILRHPDVVAVCLIALTLMVRPAQACCVLQVTGLI
jgi:hypothetical protein